ncbi:MAG TPA: MarR family winged helix-turn-helix transcriptional regulator [Candidatus Saccharimonadales bacterium]
MNDDAARLIHTLLQQLATVFAREFDQILQEQLGVGYSQYKILAALAGNPAMLQKRIAFELGQTEASVSRQARLLQREGFIENKINPKNRREHLLRLSPKGQRITDAALEILHAYQQESLRHMPRKERAQLLELLSRVHR